MASSRNQVRPQQKYSRKFWTLFWTFLFIAIIWIGANYSPLTRINQLTIVSDAKEDIPRLKSVISKYKNLPAMQLPVVEIKTEVLRNLRVESVKFQSNVFGRAELAVKYRKPVAKISNVPSYFVDEHGVLFPSKDHKPNLTIVTNLQQIHPILCLSDQSELSDLARLAAKLQVRIPKLAGNLDLDAAGRLFFQVSGKSKIVFGRGERLDEKIAVLTKTLAEDPNVLEKAKEINLVEPEAPAMTPK